jgi:hypothetical protein
VVPNGAEVQIQRWLSNPGCVAGMRIYMRLRERKQPGCPNCIQFSAQHPHHIKSRNVASSNQHCPSELVSSTRPRFSNV